MAGGIRGLVPALTSFVGRADEIEKVSELLAEYRLVTVTGPGGVGKTRLADEVIRSVVGRFADGIWLVDLAAVQEPSLVPAVMAAALGLHQTPGVSTVEALKLALHNQQSLLMLDNCEHVLDAAGQLCTGILQSSDDLRILTTSREPLGLTGEARYRLSPLALPDLHAPGGAGMSEAEVLFYERARQLDPQFTLDEGSRRMVAQVVQRLDGMPLAIELAAARVEGLGLPQLLERLDKQLSLLFSTNRAATARQRSLSATIDWSYQLLSQAERQAFRRLAMFPAPFTLEAAASVVGTDPESAVLRLVDCSLLAPPRTGPDQRARYEMLETLRAFGLERLSEAGEEREAAAALAAYTLRVAEQAALEMTIHDGELSAARWLDAEEAAAHQGLTWSLEHDPPGAMRLAVALAKWWRLRGRWVQGVGLLQRAAERAGRSTDAWCSGQLWLGHLFHAMSGYSIAIDHFNAVVDGLGAGPPSTELVDGLAGRSGALRNLGRLTEAGDDALAALEMARGIDYSAGEAVALGQLCLTSHYLGGRGGLELARQMQQIDQARIPAWIARRCQAIFVIALADAGRPADAVEPCAAGLAQARTAGDLGDQADLLSLMVMLARQSGQPAVARVHLHEMLELARQTGHKLRLIDGLDECGHWCVMTGQYAEAITLWSARMVHSQDTGLPELPEDANSRMEPMQKAMRMLGSTQARGAERRGAAMTLAVAVDFAMILTDEKTLRRPAAASRGNLTKRQLELVILVAQGQTDAQIAEQLGISVRTVRSHLDRIRDKTGCRRRADLTRLALQEGVE